MNERQLEIIKHLFDLAGSYYTETEEDGEGTFLSVPDTVKEKDFIQEVYMALWEVLDEDRS